MLSRYSLLLLLLSSTVLFGQSGPSPLNFLPAVDYVSGGYAGTTVAVGDVNGDGKPDVVLIDRCINSECYLAGSLASVFLGNGDGTFKPAMSHEFLNLGVSWGTLADVNRDGKLDLVVGIGCGFNSNLCPGVAILLGNGDGTFQPLVTYPAGPFGAYFLTAADVNGDGNPDLIVSNVPSGSISGSSAPLSVLLGNGDGTFQAPVTYDAGGSGAAGIAVADVNGDGKPDLVLANVAPPLSAPGIVSSPVAVLLGNGDGPFQPAMTYSSGGVGSGAVAVADLNGDGKLDVVVESECPVVNDCSPGSTVGNVGVLLGNGDGTFEDTVSYSSGGSSATYVTVADVNGDGIPDVEVTNQSGQVNGGTPGVVDVLLGNGDGTFQAPVTYNSGGTTAIGLAVADVNGDGRPDLLAANTDFPYPNISLSTVGVLLNNTKYPTVTALASQLNPATVGQPVPLSATVTSNIGTPNGTVTFMQNGTYTLRTATLSGGQATLDKTFTVAETRSIIAIYSGSARLATSASTALQQAVMQATTTTTLASSLNPSSVGQSVTFTAFVIPQFSGTPTGTVTFKNGANVIGTASLSGGSASLTKLLDVATPKSISAVYFGDANFAGSTSSALNQVVNQATTISAVFFDEPLKRWTVCHLNSNRGAAVRRYTNRYRAILAERNLHLSDSDTE